MASKHEPQTALRTHETPVRVRYGEVDRMGFVYHGHYLVYFETGRTEMLRSLNDVEAQRTNLLQRRLPEDQDVQFLTIEIRRLEQQLQGIAATYLASLGNQARLVERLIQSGAAARAGG